MEDAPRPGRSASVEEVKNTVQTLVNGRRVRAAFTEGRRVSDLLLVALSGPKQAVLDVPLRLADRLEHEDIELLEAEGSAERYTLSLVVTEAIETQESIDQERRAKLRNRLALEVERLA